MQQELAEAQRVPEAPEEMVDQDIAVVALVM
jgi:hypothetical protein